MLLQDGYASISSDIGPGVGPQGIKPAKNELEFRTIHTSLIIILASSMGRAWSRFHLLCIVFEILVIEKYKYK